MSIAQIQPVHLHGLDFDIAGFSEQGPRPENQDAFVVDSFATSGLVAVADGMGGERSGRLAADTALNAVAASPIRSLDDARRAVRSADQAVTRSAGEDPDQREGMGCALGLLVLRPTTADGPQWVGAYVGDVRILSRSPDGTVRLESRDHTPAFARWEAGEIELDDVPDTEGANRLQRAVGRGGEADVVWLPARLGWSYLLVSDGITKAMRVDELGEAMAAPSAADCCDIIRQKVQGRGPDDNYTAVVVRVLGNPALPAHEATLPYPGESTLPHPPSQMNQRQSGSLSMALIGLLAVLALAAGGFALWTAWELQRQSVARTEVERLQADVDSLRAEVMQFTEPFGPAVTAPPLPDSAAPTTTEPENQP